MVRLLHAETQGGLCSICHWLLGVSHHPVSPGLQPEIWSQSQIWGQLQRLPGPGWPHESQPAFPSTLMLCSVSKQRGRPPCQLCSRPVWTEQVRHSLHPRGRQSNGKVGTSTTVMEPSGVCWLVLYITGCRCEGQMAKHGFADEAISLAQMPTLPLGNIWNMRLSCTGHSRVFHLPSSCGCYFTDTFGFPTIPNTPTRQY